MSRKLTMLYGNCSSIIILIKTIKIPAITVKVSYSYENSSVMDILRARDARCVHNSILGCLDEGHNLVTEGPFFMYFIKYLRYYVRSDWLVTMFILEDRDMIVQKFKTFLLKECKTSAFVYITVYRHVHHFISLKYVMPKQVIHLYTTHACKL